jgi:hypothetical protein
MSLRQITGALAAVVLTLLMAVAGVHPAAEAQTERFGQQANDLRVQPVAIVPAAQRLLTVLTDHADDGVIPVDATALPKASCRGEKPFFPPLPVVRTGDICPPARGPPGLAI